MSPSAAVKRICPAWVLTIRDHGLMHGGASLEEGAKHLVRTDIIYECLPGTAPPAWATAKIRYMT